MALGQLSKNKNKKKLHGKQTKLFQKTQKII